MKTLEKLKNINRRILFVVTLVIFVLAIVLIATTNPTNNPLKQSISEFAGTDKFDIQDALLQDGDWYLISIESTAPSDKGDITYVIIKTDGEEMYTVFDLGTYFTVDELFEKDVPESIIRYFHGDDTLWVGFDYLSSIYSEELSENAQVLIKRYTQDKSIDLNRVFIVNDSAVSHTENERQDNMSVTINFRFTINSHLDNAPVFTMSAIDTESATSYKITDSNGTIVAEEILGS